MIRALMDGTGLTYDDVRRMTCRQFWRRMNARNRWEMRKAGKEDEGSEEMTPQDFAQFRGGLKGKA
jgi:hypothetical protein